MAAVKSSVSTSDSDIPSALAGRNVLLTGGLGFLGKSFTEKLLRSVPDVGNIYLLVRPKRNKTAQERLQQVMEDPLFNRIRQDNPSALSKVVGVEGDITDDNLGLNEADLNAILSTVSVVVHAAATIKFDEHIKLALQINLKGTMNVVNLCRRLQKMEALVHVSTAYSHCVRKEIDEVFYATELCPRKLLEMSEWLDEDIQSDLLPKLLHDRPNTYILTKALAENWLAEEASDLPVTIFRPSIITASCEEPEPGWCDNLNGAHGLVLGVGKGVIRAIHLHMEKVTDCVPVDYCSRMMVCAIWNLIVNPPKKPVIYHCCTSPKNPVTYTTVFPVCLKTLYENPYDQIFARPRIHTSRTSMGCYMNLLMKHLIPAYLIDFVHFVMGKKPRMVRMYSKVHSANNIYSYFWTRQWTWHDGNYEALLSKLLPEDRNDFSFDMRQINWETYWRNLCLGTRKFIMKEDPADIPHARKQVAKFRAMRFTWNFCLMLIATRIMYLASHRYQWLRQLWLSLVAALLKLMKSASAFDLNFFQIV